MADVQIRRAVVEDVSKIRKLAESLRINLNKPQEGGFLVHVTYTQGYAARLAKNPFFYVAEREGEMAGFLMCFEDKALENLVQRGVMTAEDNTFDFIFSQPRPFLVVDQIGVDRDYARQGVGRALMQGLFDDPRGIKIKDLYAEILHAPARNQTSINFFSSLGFRGIKELTNSDNNTWGIYHASR